MLKINAYEIIAGLIILEHKIRFRNFSIPIFQNGWKELHLTSAFKCNKQMIRR